MDGEGEYITSVRVQAAIGLARQIEHALEFNYGTQDQHDKAYAELERKLGLLTADELAQYDRVIEFYKS